MQLGKLYIDLTIKVFLQEKTEVKTLSLFPYFSCEKRKYPSLFSFLESHLREGSVRQHCATVKQGCACRYITAA